jgi:2-dehydropantoate 2-reductase
MRFLIVGAGAIGSLLGNRLSRAGHAVTLVGRPGYVEAVEREGVGLEEGNEPAVYAHDVRAVSDVARVSDETFDVLIFTMKVYDTTEAAGQVRPLVERGAPVLVMQNGVGGEAQAARVLEEGAILSGVITLVVEKREPGLVCLSTTRGGIGLASTHSPTPPAELVASFREAGFRIEVYADYQAMKWSKLLLNLLGNASAAILAMGPDRIFAHRGLFELERSAFCEARMVMRAQGLHPVRLPGYPVPLLAWSLCALPSPILQPIFRRIMARGRGDKLPSLYLDLARGRKRSEVVYLNGAVVAMARELGLHVPANEALYGTLVSIASGEVDWETHRGRPEGLLATAGLESSETWRG